MRRRPTLLVLIPGLLAGSCSHGPTAEPDETPTPAAPPAASAPAPPPPPTAPQPTPPPPAPAPEPMREVLPGLRLDRAAGAVEFDGEIVQDGRDGLKYLEVLACRPNTREHESIILSDVAASNLHAALLLAGAVPGSPGSYTFDNATKTLVPHAPTGPTIEVQVRWTKDGVAAQRPLTEMVADQKTKRPLAASGARFVFAGSGFLKRKDGSERYAADVSGTLIGLCTFGDEPLAWTDVISPEESLDAPEWTVDPAAAPPRGTKVVVRLVVSPKKETGPDAP